MPQKKEMLIYLYAGDGAEASCIENTEDWLRKYLNETNTQSNIAYKIKRITSEEVENDALKNEKPDVLFMPGGNATKYSKDLKGESIQKIRDFVQDGGIFQGICAGAYFASELFYYENPKTGNKIELSSEQDEVLGVNYVMATSEPHEHLKEAKIKDGCQVKVKYDNNRKDKFVQVYYNRGPYLTNLKDGINPKGIYADIYEGEVAVAENNYGRGKVVVSGVHPEFKASQLENVPFLSEKINDTTPEQQRDLDHFSRTVVLKHMLDKYISLDKKLDLENTSKAKELNEQLSKMKGSNPTEAISTSPKVESQTPAPSEKPKQQPLQSPKPPKA
ncbi:MAG: BPL-N domain-containing protein [Alphaproteobacteria bacterium]|nr:BPL-N domain-containing protein [Alphaproteobacteria bacterium]